MLEFAAENGSTKFENLFNKIISIFGFTYEYSKLVGNGISRCDIYVPEHDLVIFFDGPCHFIEFGH
jgi:G:T-mismatch repair DNA endonuclease (very short patch repair protein)